MINDVYSIGWSTRHTLHQLVKSTKFQVKSCIKTTQFWTIHRGNHQTLGESSAEIIITQAVQFSFTKRQVQICSVVALFVDCQKKQGK